MIRGLYTSAVAMAGQLKRMDTVTNNLSNVNTTGFKRDVVVTQAFSDVLARRVRDYELQGMSIIAGNLERLNLGPMSLGLTIHSVHRDFTIGAMQQTGGTFDLALDSIGFFEIRFVNGLGEEEMMYTRSGAFTVDAEGMLVTLEGLPVLNTGGEPIFVPNGYVQIAGGGEIRVNGEYIDTIRVVNFEDLGTLRPFADNLYSITEDTVEIAFFGNVRQGFVEASNVNSVREMVEMIALSRVYEANARMITIQDQTLGQAVNEIARR